MKAATTEKPSILEHTVADRQSRFTSETKAYYRDIETYDWVDVCDHFRGLESIFHRNRERVMRRLPPASAGLDINPRNMSKVRRYAPQSRLMLGDAEALPLQSDAFSTILCREVLEHLPNPEQALAEIERVLAPGGALIGSVPGRSPIWKLRFLSGTCPHDEPFHRMFRRAEVHALLSILDLQWMSYSLLRINVLFVARKRESA